MHIYLLLHCFGFSSPPNTEHVHVHVRQVSTALLLFHSIILFLSSLSRQLYIVFEYTGLISVLLSLPPSPPSLKAENLRTLTSGAARLERKIRKIPRSPVFNFPGNIIELLSCCALFSFFILIYHRSFEIWKLFRSILNLFIS